MPKGIGYGGKLAGGRKRQPSADSRRTINERLRVLRKKRGSAARKPSTAGVKKRRDLRRTA